MADLIAAIRNGKQEIQQTSNLVEDVKTSLAEIRAHSNIYENARRMSTLSSAIDASLAKARGFAAAFQTAVGKARTEFSAFAARVRQKTTIVAVLLTAILAWVALGQASLTVHGWSTLRTARHADPLGTAGE